MDNFLEDLMSGKVSLNSGVIITGTWTPEAKIALKAAAIYMSEYEEFHNKIVEELKISSEEMVVIFVAYYTALRHSEEYEILHSIKTGTPILEKALEYVENAKKMVSRIKTKNESIEET